MSTTNSLFHNILQTSENSAQPTLEDSLLYTFHEESSIAANLPFLRSICQITLHAFEGYFFSVLHAYCLLKVSTGHCFISYQGKNTTLDSEHVAFFACDGDLTLQSINKNTTLEIYLITGPVADIFDPFLSFSTNFLYEVTPKITLLCQQLLSTTESSPLHNLTRSSILVELFTSMCQNLEVSTTSAYVPSYLKQIKATLEQSYGQHISLKTLEDTCHINRFRICKDFQCYYHTSPMQYLTHCRMEAAERLLQNSNETITKIGQLVGIENTTHFINLFKQKNGVTPLQFRQCTPHL